jgi:uncharacterized membrane protein YadS
LGFLLLAVLNTAHIIPDVWSKSIAHGGSIFLVAVLASVGLGVDINGIRRMGSKPLLVGVTIGAAMAILSLVLISSLSIG